MKRVLFLNYEYPPLGGGAGNSTKYLLKEYSKMDDIEVDLVTSSVDEFRIEDLSPNVRIHFLDINKNGNLHYQSQKDLLVYAWRAFWYARKLKKHQDYNIVHAFLGIPCGFVAMFLGLPYVVSLRGSDIPFYNERFYYLDKFIFRFLSRIIWLRSAAVTALSNDSVKMARKTSKTQEIKVIHNGIDIDEFCPNDEILNKEETFNILFVGRIIVRKGLIYLLRAFKDIVKKYPQARLLIVSDGPLKSKYEQYVKDEGFADKVNFLGLVPHDDLPSVFQKSHLFVLPSLSEALGAVTQEALGAGLPIITTNTGAAEVVGDGGIVVNIKSSEEIKEAIEKVISNEELSDKMAKESRRLALAMSWEAVAKQYIALYDESKK